MIIYYSGTGNSAFVAERIAAHTGDELVSANKAIKAGERGDYLSESKPYVFVSPTYSWRLPRIFEQFIRESTFRGQNKVYFVLTCGGSSANAIHYVQKLCLDKNWDLAGFSDVVMPENYTAMFTCPEPDEATAIVARSLSKIDALAEQIKRGEPFPPHKAKHKFLSLSTPFFYALFVKSNEFRVNDDCIGCNQCIEHCPLNNIVWSDEEKKPVYRDHCTHCMACINICPVRAIDYGTRTQGKPRYFFSRDIDRKPLDKETAKDETPRQNEGEHA